MIVCWQKSSGKHEVGKIMKSWKPSVTVDLHPSIKKQNPLISPSLKEAQKSAPWKKVGIFNKYSMQSEVKFQPSRQAYFIMILFIMVFFIKIPQIDLKYVVILLRF